MSCCLLLLQRTKLNLIKRGALLQGSLIALIFWGRGEYQGKHNEAQKVARRTVFTLTPSCSYTNTEF